MNWLLKILVIWVSVDTLLIATIWYVYEVIRLQFPNWWREVVCADGLEIGVEL